MLPLLTLPVLAATPAKLEVQSDLAAAQKFAKENKRLLFVEFMMPNCGHCQEFKKEVLSSEAFVTYANVSLSVFICDFTDDKKMPEDASKLASEHSVQYTPTILIFDQEGKKLLLRTVGYQGTPPEKIIANLKALAEK